jgi:hypothetical protein
MSALKYERLRELEVALALKQREIDLLRTRCDEAREGHKHAMNGLINTCVSNVTCNEVLDAIPFEQIRNAIAQLDAQKHQEVKATRIFQRTIGEVEIAIAEHEKEQVKLRENIELMIGKTGMDEKRAKLRAEDIKKSIEEDHKSGAADANGALVPRAELNQSRALATALVPIEMRVQYQQLMREIHAVKVLKVHNAKAIDEMAEAIERQKAIRTKRCEVLAEYKVAEREMTLRKATLKTLVTEHDKLDQHAKAVKDRTDQGCRAILDKDSVTLRGRLDQCVERRRLQDRVIKAQQLRLLHLNQRLATVQAGLQRHGLAKEVDLRISEAEREAAKQSGGSGSQLIQFPENEEEAFYDVEAIVPVEETVHPAIYALFVEDREKLQRRVNTQAMMLQEKSESIDSLDQGLQTLQQEVLALQDELHYKTIDQQKQVEELKSRLVTDIQVQREEYAKLVKRGRSAQARVSATRARASSSQPALPCWSK